MFIYLCFKKKIEAMIEANNPKLTSWIEVSNTSDFPIQNIPFGMAIINSAWEMIRKGQFNKDV